MIVAVCRVVLMHWRRWVHGNIMTLARALPRGQLCCDCWLYKCDPCWTKQVSQRPRASSLLRRTHCPVQPHQCHLITQALNSQLSHPNPQLGQLDVLPR